VSTHILGVVQLLVLTSIVVAAATAAARTPADSRCQLGDRATAAAVGGPCDRDVDQCIASPEAAPVTPIALPPAPAVAFRDGPVAPTQAPATRAVIAFAPKTSPPRARWF
jgi:hypothetical protein